VVDEATHPWGVKVTRIEIKDIQPPRDLVDAMAPPDEGRAREARQHPRGRGHARRPRSCAPRARSSRRCWKAEGRKEAAFRDAEARERLAEAEAKATMMVSQAIAKGDVQAINYFVAQKYVEALQALATSAEPEGADDAAGSHQRDRLDRRRALRTSRCSTVAANSWSAACIRSTPRSWMVADA
jgi:regulator of protease activity HflC (stomatin/prohibitin superfamily)